MIHTAKAQVKRKSRENTKHSEMSPKSLDASDNVAILG